jgi:hypothetical protein
MPKSPSSDGSRATATVVMRTPGKTAYPSHATAARVSPFAVRNPAPGPAIRTDRPGYTVYRGTFYR